MMLTVATAISRRWESLFVEELAEIPEAELVRRCADVDELQALVEAGSVTLAALSADLLGVDGQLVAELTMRGATVLGVCGPNSLVDARAFESWGVTQVHVLGSGELENTITGLHLLTTHSSGEEAVGAVDPSPTPQNEPLDGVQGEVLAVWGPPGSPGRTTIACHMADRLARSESTLLIDADTYAPSVAGVMGILDEAPGILAAARLSDAGTLNEAQLVRVAAHLGDNFDVLTGIGRASRWTELTARHVAEIVSWARRHYRWVVIDVASDVSSDEDLMYDTIAPVRNVATLSALEHADRTIVVAAADPINLQRFVSAWPSVTELAPQPLTVVNKARAQAVGGKPEVLVARALERFTDVTVDVYLPDARAELDDALLNARLITQTAPDHPFVEALGKVVNRIAPHLATVGSGRPRSRLPWR